jgi:hypothetical protein
MYLSGNGGGSTQLGLKNGDDGVQCGWAALHVLFEEEHIKASYTDGQQSQDRTK